MLTPVNEGEGTDAVMLRRLLASPVLIPIGMAVLIGSALLTPSRPATDEGGRPIVVYAHPPCPPDLMAIYEPLFARFRAEHPEIHLTVLHITGNYEDKVKVMFAGNVAPDVIFMYPTALPAWVDLGALLPLEGLLGHDGTRGYFKPMIDAFTRDGGLFGLPKDASAPVLYYNVDLFERCGVAMPTASWTWDDLLAAAKALTRDTDGDGRIDRWGLNVPLWQMFVWAYGGQVLDAAGRHCVLDSPQAIAGLTFWAELRHKHGVTPTPEAGNDLNALQMFSLQRVAMDLQMYPAVSVYRQQAGFTWDIAAAPSGPAGRVTEVQGSALAVTSQSRNRRAAFTFAHWMTTEGMRGLVSVEAPSWLPLARSDAFTGSGGLPAAKGVALDAMSYARPPVQHPRFAELNDIFRLHLDQASRGVIPVEEAVRRIVPEADRVLDRYWKDRPDE